MPAAGCALKRALWCSGLVGADARESDLGRGGTSDSGGGYTQRAGEGVCDPPQSAQSCMLFRAHVCMQSTVNFGNA